MTANAVQHYNRSELRQVIALDHSYSKSPDHDPIHSSSLVARIDQNEEITLKPEIPLTETLV